MKDIADRVGLSKSAVSLVLSGKAGRRVSEDMKRKVLEAAREMDYHVNEVARSLRTGQSGIICVIVTDISNEFFGKTVFHIQEAAKKRNYMVMTVNTNENPQEFEESLRMVVGKHVDGIICVTPPCGEDALRRLVESGMPCVQFDRQLEGLPADYVGVDNYRASRDAVRSLFSSGVGSVAMVGLDLDVPPLIQRRKGYEDAVKERGLSSAVHKISYDENTEDEQMKTVVERLLSETSPYDAIYFTSRRVFTHAMNIISQSVADLRKDTRFLCFDDVSSYRLSSYSVSYVCQPVKEMAEKSFELLFGKIGGRQTVDISIFDTETF